MGGTVNISILLHKSWRTPEGISRVQEIASTLGLVPSASGRVSISCKVPVDRFSELFNFSPISIESTLPGENDFGSPGGHYCEEEISVPGILKEYVETISIVPPARRMI